MATIDVVVFLEGEGLSVRDLQSCLQLPRVQYVSIKRSLFLVLLPGPLSFETVRFNIMLFNMTAVTL